MPKITQLSKNFSLAEFTYSQTAVKQGIDNDNPGQLAILRMSALCDHVLEPVRKFFCKPVLIRSGWRSIELNAAVGGRPDSQHMRGEAADIKIQGVANVEIWRYIQRNLDFDQLIAERLSQMDGSVGWIHVSYCGVNRHEALSFLGGNMYTHGLHYAS